MRIDASEAAQPLTEIVCFVCIIALCNCFFNHYSNKMSVFSSSFLQYRSLTGRGIMLRPVNDLHIPLFSPERQQAENPSLPVTRNEFRKFHLAAFIIHKKPFRDRLCNN